MSHPAENVYGCYGSNAGSNVLTVPYLEQRVAELEKEILRLKYELEAHWIHIHALEKYIDHKVSQEHDRISGQIKYCVWESK